MQLKSWWSELRQKSQQAISVLAIEVCLTSIVAWKVRRPLRSATLHCIVSSKCANADRRATSRQGQTNRNSLAGAAKEAFYVSGSFCSSVWSTNEPQMLRHFSFSEVLTILYPSAGHELLTLHVPGRVNTYNITTWCSEKPYVTFKLENTSPMGAGNHTSTCDMNVVILQYSGTLAHWSMEVCNFLNNTVITGGVIGGPISLTSNAADLMHIYLHGCLWRTWYNLIIHKTQMACTRRLTQLSFKSCRTC
jgi:hypothetical protein